MQSLGPCHPAHYGNLLRAGAIPPTPRALNELFDLNKLSKQQQHQLQMQLNQQMQQQQLGSSPVAACGMLGVPGHLGAPGNPYAPPSSHPSAHGGSGGAVAQAQSKIKSAFSQVNGSGCGNGKNGNSFEPTNKVKNSTISNHAGRLADSAKQQQHYSQSSGFASPPSQVDNKSSHKNREQESNSGHANNNNSGGGNNSTTTSGSSSSSSVKGSNSKPELNPACQPRCNCPDLVRVEAKLETKELWDKFNELGTEMIITKTGRR